MFQMNNTALEGVHLKMKSWGRARWLTPIIPALWEAEVRVNHKVKRSRPSWSTK